MTTPTSAAGPWISGSLVTSTATYATENGTITDPSTITLKYKTAAGSTTTAVYPASPITKVATGIYQAEFDTTGFSGPGQELWTVQWSGTGAVQAIGVSYFWIVPAAL